MNKEQLISKASEAVLNAYAPYSNYRVGAALEADDGTIHTGCNVENASYGLSFCAERAAISAAVSGGHREFKAMAIVSDGETPPVPCGACRQVMAEFCSTDFLIHVATQNDLGNTTEYRLGDLLPETFKLSKKQGA